VQGLVGLNNMGLDAKILRIPELQENLIHFSRAVYAMFLFTNKYTNC
jgi:hypothetical protein